MSNDRWVITDTTKLELGVPSPEDDISQHEPGAKLDKGKIRMGLVMHGFNLALQEVGRVGTFGANKYTDNGWKSVPDAANRYRDALYRHLMAPDTLDNESGLPHLAHAAWNALAILQFYLEEYHEAEGEASGAE